MVDPFPEQHALPAVAREVSKLLGLPVQSGHGIDVLVNGDEIFPAMLQAIAGARREICFETFIYWSGDIAQRFASALSDAERRGVSVYVLLDWWGAQEMDEQLIEQMRDAGVLVRHFNPLRWWQLQRMNYRTHRKILVVDEEVAFTGGVGIAEEWCGNARGPHEWYDLHYRMTGPAVGEMRAAFAEVWSEVLQQPRLPAASTLSSNPKCGGGDAAQVLSSAPRSGSERVYQLFRYAIESATDSFLVITAYFVPDRETIAALIAAVKRGVSVQVMIPGPHIDSQVVRYSSRSSWGELLQAGVRIHVFTPTMLHAKATIVDSEWVIVGSANFDNRSFALNDEILVNVFSDAFAAAHLTIFRENLERCEELDYDQWRKRGALTRVKELFSDLLRPQL